MPLNLLEGWQGYLMTDGYAGYNAVASCPGVEHWVCMTHTRRQFVEAKRASPKGKQTRADQALAFFAQLYRIEREVKDAAVDARFAARQQKSLPVLEALRQ